MAESTGAIMTAVAANTAIAVAKFVGAALTGSSSMLSEGVHSIVDTLNQALLLVGLKRAERKPDSKHPFGYGREVYFFSFVVALLIFLAGGLYSLYEGIEKVHHPEKMTEAVIFGFHIPGIVVNLVILVFSIAAEAYSLHVALSSLPKGAGSSLSAIRRSKDPSLFVVVAEDTAAVVGLVLALLGVGLAYVLDMPVLDGVGSVAIGLVLILVAGFLMFETHGLLIGEAADPDVVAAIEAVARNEPAVRHVNEILTQHLGPTDILVNISVDIDDSISGGDAEMLVSRIDAGLKARSKAVRRVFIEIQAQSHAAKHDERRAPSETV